MAFFYRHYDASDCLLYVGISKDWGKRTVTHMLKAEWFDEVKTMIVEKCDSIEDAAKLEVDWVRSKKPKYNKVRFITPDEIDAFMRKVSENYQKKHPLVIEAIRRCGGPGYFCEKMGISRQALNQWKGNLPELRRYQIEEMISSLPENPDKFAIRRMRKRKEKNTQLRSK
jgi:predicted GIY-YIG superfamily endonuclease